MKAKKLIWIAGAVLIMALSLLWLGGAFAFLPSDSAVTRSFCNRHPEFRVARVIRGGGDSDQFSFQIKYCASDSAELRSAHWLVYTSGVHLGWRLDSEVLDISTQSAETNLN